MKLEDFKVGSWVWEMAHGKDTFYYIVSIEKDYVKTLSFAFNKKEFEVTRVHIAFDEIEGYGQNFNSINIHLGADRELIFGLFDKDTKDGIYI